MLKGSGRQEFQYVERSLAAELIEISRSHKSRDTLVEGLPSNWPGLPYATSIVEGNSLSQRLAAVSIQTSVCSIDSITESMFDSSVTH